jgi:hypothetical protein
MVVDNVYHGKMTPRLAEQILQQLGQGAKR